MYWVCQGIRTVVLDLSLKRGWQGKLENRGKGKCPGFKASRSNVQLFVWQLFARQF
jgi:hypothetical protein